MYTNPHVVTDTGILFATVTAFRCFLRLPRPKLSRTLLLLLACLAISLGSHLFTHYVFTYFLGPMFTLGLFPLLLVTYRRRASETFLILMLSFGFSLFIYLLAIIPVAFVQAQLLRVFEREEWHYYLFGGAIAILMQIYLHLFFRLPRLKNGLPYLKSKGLDVIGAVLGFLFLLIFSFLQGLDGSAVGQSGSPLLMSDGIKEIFKHPKAFEKYLGPAYMVVVLVLIMGIAVLVWILSRITREYQNRIRAREMQLLSNDLHRQMSENDRLSSLLHRDNKLLLGMQLSVDEVLAGFSALAAACDVSGAVPALAAAGDVSGAGPAFAAAGSADADGGGSGGSSSARADPAALAARAASLRKELSDLAADRSGTVKRYELEAMPLPKIGIPSADTQLAYMQKRAAGEGIFLDVVSDGTVKQFVPENLEESEFVTLLADLLENALHATAAAGGDRIFLYVGLRDDIFGIEVSDTGVPFPPAVAEAYGKRRKTTRADEGGTGIGLMTTYDILSRRGGSFHVKTLPENAPYKKTLSIRFDYGKDSFE